MRLDELETGQVLSSEVFLVAEASLQVDRRGDNYYNLVLNHEGGKQIDAKVWSDNIEDEIEAGCGLEVLARVDEFRGNTQLNIQRYTVLDDDDFDPSNYVQTTDIDQDEAFQTLFNWDCDEFQNPFLKQIVQSFHDNESFARTFKKSPAARFHHHAYEGGLIEHTLEVWKLADAMCALYGDKLDREIVLAGAALHDIGKIKAYRLTAGVSEHTDVGMLLDHIFISASMVSNQWDREVKPDVPDDRAEEAARCKSLLLHLILSHHGRNEWGSPVLPRTSEAVLLHYADEVSASMRKCFDALDGRPAGKSWTDSVYLMDAPRELFQVDELMDEPEE